MKLNALGMPKYPNKAHPTERYVAVRPDGRRSRVSFRSPLRAAEHAMNAFGIDNWRNLCSIGWTVQPISHFRKAHFLTNHDVLLRDNRARHFPDGLRRPVDRCRSDRILAEAVMTNLRTLLLQAIRLIEDEWGGTSATSEGNAWVKEAREYLAAPDEPTPATAVTASPIAQAILDRVTEVNVGLFLTGAIDHIEKGGNLASGQVELRDGTLVELSMLRLPAQNRGGSHG